MQRNLIKNISFFSSSASLRACYALLLLTLCLGHDLKADADPAESLGEEKTSNAKPASEPLYSDYTVSAIQRFLWMDVGSPLGSTVTEEMQFLWVLEDRLQTEENRYLAAAYYTNYLIDTLKHARVQSLCQEYPPKPDHYEYAANCTLGADLPILESTKRIEALGDEALKKYPNRLVAVGIFRAAGSLLGNQGHAHESIRMYKKVFEALPSDAAEDIAESKLNLAAAYANPLLSQSLQKLAPKYYAEVRSWYTKQEPTPYILGQIKWVSYNKAISHLFMFEEYEQALSDLDTAEGYADLKADIKVFKAYAFAKSKQPEAARATLKSVDLQGYADPERLAFLTCYMDLSRRIMGDPISLQSCLTLKAPQADVLLDLTETISKLSLDPREENQMWRIFYKFFSEHLKPDFQDSMASAASEAELQQEKAESRLKDLKLKNLSLYQDLTYALLAVAGVCGLALFLAIRSWKNSRKHATEMSTERARLQYIMDNIEEGLILIRPSLLMEPEDSKHLTQITGGHDLRDKNLKSLLSLSNLSEDSQSITIQCLGAILGEGSLAWELNQPNLPSEAQIDDREVAFYWQALFEGDVIHSILLVLRDITAINALERTSKKAREQADCMLEYAREILSCHPRAVTKFLGELPRMIQLLSFSALQSNDTTNAMHIAHSIKGTARTLGLLDLQNQAHWVEDELRSHSTIELKVLVDELIDLAQIYNSAMQHVLGDISDMDVRSLFDLVAHHKPALERQLAAADLSLGNLMVDESISLTRAELQPLAEVVLHALTNAADHGFILPKRQGRNVDDARFAVSVFQRGDHRILILRDNGNGVDHQKIHQQAQKRGWSPAEDQIWSDFLFLEGVTTAESLTMTSGRGVGMSAIRNAAGKLQGRVQLLDNDEGPGAMLKITWPVAKDVAA